jgi:hypothetical protein
MWTVGLGVPEGAIASKELIEMLLLSIRDCRRGQKGVEGGRRGSETTGTD